MRSRILAAAVCVALGSSGLFAGTVGWRTDGTGRYPDAKPVTEWSPEKNVVWKTEMKLWPDSKKPHSSNSTPVIVGDRLFVCAEPDTLVCVKLSDGKILWKKRNPVIETLSPEEGEALKAKMKEIDVAGKYGQMRKLESQAGRLRRQLRKSPNDEALKKQYQDLRTQINALKEAVNPFINHMPSSAHNVNGHTSMTPVSDGRHVWAHFGPGVVACYDLEGNRKWIKFAERPRQGYGTSASPVLAGGKLLVHVNDMTALDAATGEEKWKCRGLRHSWGTSLVTKIGDAEVLVTPGGDFVRVSDGRRIARGVSKLDYCAPLIEGGRIYYIQNGSGFVKIPDAAGDDVKPEQVWRCTPKRDRYYSSPVLRDGLIYAVNRNRIMSCIDAKDGKVVWEQNLSGKLGRGQAYSSIVSAGDHIFVSSDDGTTLVLQPGREFKEIARNKLETFRATPVFKGSRMYVRGYKHLWCVGK